MLNPITYTERVVQDFLRDQLAAYPLADVQAVHHPQRSAARAANGSPTWRPSPGDTRRRSVP